ncbi:hypothetical protein MMC25_001494 [Agyrium rufum]|nr:hypothetical protein [Agyrium rufum]
MELGHKYEEAVNFCKYLKIQYAYSGTGNVGPMLSLRRTVLDAEPIEKRCSVHLLNSQLSATCFMLRRSCGEFPLHRSLHFYPKAMAAAQEVSGLLINVTGLGKLTQPWPSQVVFPPSTPGWTRMDSLADFPKLTTVLCAGEKPKDVVRADNWISRSVWAEDPETSLM